MFIQAPHRGGGGIAPPDIKIIFCGGGNMGHKGDRRRGGERGEGMKI